MNNNTLKTKTAFGGDCFELTGNILRWGDVSAEITGAQDLEDLPAYFDYDSIGQLLRVLKEYNPEMHMDPLPLLDFDYDYVEGET